ncbi:MAG: hypothetical protein NTV94_02980, partial [Planctomycetota bacterium]|nr:hypothetical protein [Planctomycetota bacterium]
ESRVVEWATRAAVYRLMLSASENSNVDGATRYSQRKISQLQNALARTGAAATAADCLELLWQRSDELAPARHPRRAWFFVNFALAGKVYGLQIHFDEALAKAEEALPDAVHPERVRAMIGSAREK